MLSNKMSKLHLVEPAVLFLLAFCFAITVQSSYVNKYGNNLTHLLHVSASSGLAAYIAKDFPDISYGPDHDGQINYVIARNPFGNRVIAPLIEPAGFRYRRWLYPAFSGGFGFFSPGLTLNMMVYVNALAFAFSVVLFSSILKNYGGGLYTPLVLFLHPGMITALLILTADNLAIAFSLFAFLLYLRNKFVAAAIALAAAVLTKEIYLLIAISLALHQFLMKKRFTAMYLVIIASLPLSCWLLVYSFLNPESGGEVSLWGNVDIPLRGLFSSIPRWFSGSFERGFYPLLTAAVMLIGWSLIIFLRFKDALPRLLLLPWLVMPLFLSDWIWRPGSDAIRGLAPLFMFVVLVLMCKRAELLREEGHSV